MCTGCFIYVQVAYQAFIACRLDWSNSLLYGVPGTCCEKSSRCKTPPLVYSRAHGAVTTSLQCCVNVIGCRTVAHSGHTTFESNIGKTRTGEIVVRGSHNTIFLKKILCCRNVPQHNIFWKKIVLCDTFAQHNFFEKNCVVRTTYNNFPSSAVDITNYVTQLTKRICWLGGPLWGICFPFVWVIFIVFNTLLISCGQFLTSNVERKSFWNSLT